MVKNYIVVNKHKSYLQLYDWFINKAYDRVYASNIMIYTSEGLNPSREDIETAKRNFIRLARGMMGEKIENQLIEFFGSEETLIQNMILFFDEKTMTDELLDLIQKHKEQFGAGPSGSDNSDETSDMIKQRLQDIGIGPTGDINNAKS